MKRLCGFLLACGAVSTTWATGFYAVDWSGTSGAPSSSSLYLMDSVSGPTLIGDTGLTRLNSLSYTSSGDLATFSSTNGSGYLINKTTGAASFLFDQVGMASDDVRAVAINGSGWYVINESTPDLLYRIDPSSGIATLVGSTGRTGIQSLAFDPTSGELYGVDIGVGGAFSVLGTLSTVTGTFTAIGPGNSTAADPQTICFGADGTLYGLETNEIYTWNKVTGDAAVYATGSWGVDVRGAEVVPEPATIAALATGFAFIWRRRNRR